jgi:N6-adenosine-specific RNA methylase IME4
MNALLYQNPSRDVTLVDIPTSIAAAQSRSGTLLSTPPLHHPIEPAHDYRPKATAPKANNNNHDAADYDRHVEYRACILSALAQIHAHVPTPWCLPRKVLPGPPNDDNAIQANDPEKELETHFREWAAWGDRKQDDAASSLQQMMASLGAPESQGPQADTAAAHDAWLMTTTESVSQHEPWTSTFHNPEPHSLPLTLRQPHSAKEHHFTIPPRSTLFLSDSAHSESFRASFRELTDEYNLPRHFDVVLLDPPWPNRSAKRKGAYEQIGGMPYLKKMLFRMDIDNYLEHNALIGVWITNKSSLREHVLGPGGLFETWNVGLFEEWIWIKTTTKGEPMFDIDSPMRKPYEILLLGRAAPNAWTTMTHAPHIRRRVIAAVPDMHSRKPCLKKMLEEYIPEPADYSALEVFSRYLVTGWTSWGNEVLKFNCDYYWTSEDDECTDSSIGRDVELS